MKTNIALILSFLTTLTAPFVAHAEREGHGGRIWICTQPDGSVKYELLDYQLGRDRWKMTLDFPQGKDEYEIIRGLLARLSTVEPDRARIYLERALHFMDRVKLSDDEVLDFGDVNTPVLKPQNCEPKQIVHQMPPEAIRTPDDAKYKFLITRKFWDPLDPVTRAGIILHEIEYEAAVFEGQEYSDSIMYLNAYLASASMAQTNLPGWLDILKKLDLGYYYSELLFDAKAEYEMKNGRFASATLKKTGDPEMNRIKNETEDYRIAGKIKFYESGQIESVQDAEGQLQDPLRSIQVSGPVRYYKSGKIRGLVGAGTVLQNGMTITFKQDDQEERIYAWDDGEKGVMFFESGTLAEVNASVVDASRAMQLAGRISFYPNGNIEKLYGKGTMSQDGMVIQLDLNPHGNGSTFYENGNLRNTGGRIDRIPVESTWTSGINAFFYETGEVKFFEPVGSFVVTRHQVEVQVGDIPNAFDYGRILVSPSHRLISALLQKKVKLRTTAGDSRKFVRAERVYFNERGDAMVNGIFSRLTDLYYIAVVRNKSLITFSYCPVEQNGPSCVPIGKTDGYRLKDLKSALAGMFPNEANLQWLDNLDEGAFVSFAGGVFAELWFGVIAAAGAPFALLIGAPFIAYGLVEAGISAPFRFVADHTAKSRAFKRFVNKRYEFWESCRDRYDETTCTMAGMRDDLEKMLQKIPQD